MRRSPVRFREAAPRPEAPSDHGRGLDAKPQPGAEVIGFADQQCSAACGLARVPAAQALSCGGLWHRDRAPGDSRPGPGDSPARHFHGSSLYGEVLRSSTDTYPKYVPNTLYTELRFWRSVVQLGRVA